MLIGALALLGLSMAAVIAGLGYAVLELVLRNYRLSVLGSLTVIAATPFVLIGHNLTVIATDLVAHR